MAKAPDLLNDDGSASMATAFMMSHHGLRRDIARFAIALRGLADGDQAHAAALREEWRSYRDTLHGHHHIENERLFPSLQSQHAALVPVIERLTADHQRIDPLLERGDRAFAQLPATAAALAVVTELAALLDPHLATEEQELVPFLRDQKGFPPPANDAEAELYAQGFAWSSHGIASEVLKQVDAMLPEALAARLAAARTVFDQRAERVWGPVKPGASRTPIPDWLTGS